ncbi:claudin-like in caenorhabditis [Anaeramoeba ignava]|uniref:Claudin-like in caenorhabditis n=1 Tax=Anaeramoeba ignava TaxID=1746090 RepID=A0A9Q0L965_ANAIG|nr:claudin-like in caenorhabditis [Anaeramoeba ignava]
MFRFLAFLAMTGCLLMTFLSLVMPCLVVQWQEGYAMKISFGNFQTVCIGGSCPDNYEGNDFNDWKDDDKDVYNGLCANIAMTLIGLIMFVATLFLHTKKANTTHLVFVTAGIFTFIGIMAFIGKFQNSDTYDAYQDNKDAFTGYHWSYSGSAAFSIIAFIISLPGAFFALKAKSED